MGAGNKPGACCLLVAEGLVLGITRGFDLYDVGLPGGHADAEDPSSAHTAARELFEETGVLVDPRTLVFVKEAPTGGKAFRVTQVEQWPEYFSSRPFEGYVRFYSPASFLQPTCRYAQFNYELFVQEGIFS